MSQRTFTISTSKNRTKILVREGLVEMMKALLPAPFAARAPKMLQTLRGGWAPMLGQGLRVVVSAGDLDGTSSFGLTDDLGTRQNSVHYTGVVIDPKSRPRAQGIPGVGDFRDLRQLSLGQGGDQ